jgi:hypothetical protein
MKFLTIALLILITIITAAPLSLAQSDASPAQAQAGPLTLDEVLAKYYYAIGGLAAWQKVDTMVMEGVIHTQDQKIPTAAEYMRPDKCRVEYTIRDEVVIQAYDGASAWEKNPHSTSPGPVKLDKGRTDYLGDKCDIEGPLVGYKNKNLKVTLDGRETVGKVNTYKIKVAYPSGNLQYYFLDPETFRPVQAVGVFTVDGKSSAVKTRFDDYRNTSGLYIPFRLLFDKEGDAPTEELRVGSVVVNSGVSENIFTMPAK